MTHHNTRPIWVVIAAGLGVIVGMAIMLVSLVAFSMIQHEPKSITDRMNDLRLCEAVTQCDYA